MKSKQNVSENYGEDKVHQMVMKRYKNLRNDGILESLQDIYSKMPPSRINKESYIFSFDTIKNNIEQKINDRGKLQKILSIEAKNLRDIEIKNLYEVTFDNEDALYKEKLKSGLPIFKSIQFLRYQDNQKWTQFFGEEKAFITDQSNIDLSQNKANISNLKLFLQDQTTMPKVNFDFKDQNSLQIKFDRYPTLHQLQKRADVLAKLMLLSIFTEEHRKLKQSWKNDQNYQDMQKNQKKLKSDMEPQKLKEGETAQIEQQIKSQVNKIWAKLQERTNIVAHEHFRNMNGEKAVQTKKSLQKLRYQVMNLHNCKDQLKLLVSYKQKKSW